MLAALILTLAAGFIPPCVDDGPQETACYWSAVDQGDGQGRSFVDLGNSVTLYL